MARPNQLHWRELPHACQALVGESLYIRPGRRLYEWL